MTLDDCRFVQLAAQTFWGYMIKRLSAYGGCLGDKRR